MATKKERVGRDEITLRAIRTALGWSAPAGQEPKWGELLSEFVARLLLDILRFEGERRTVCLQMLN